LAYDAFRHRTVKSNDSQHNTVYVGDLYERRITPDATVHVYSILAEGRVVAQVHLAVGAAGLERKTFYIHDDRLGSAEAITDDLGNTVERIRTDPFGARRDPDDPTRPYSSSSSLDSITVGFAGTESDQEFGLVNMRGRMYDPELGRFLSADPLVSHPFSTQGLNRYAYALNNPLSFVDPSGLQDESGADAVPGSPAAGGPNEVSGIAIQRSPVPPPQKGHDVHLEFPIAIAASKPSSLPALSTPALPDVSWMKRPSAPEEAGNVASGTNAAPTPPAAAAPVAEMGARAEGGAEAAAEGGPPRCILPLRTAFSWVSQQVRFGDLHNDLAKLIFAEAGSDNVSTRSHLGAGDAIVNRVHASDRQQFLVRRKAPNISAAFALAARSHEDSIWGQIVTRGQLDAVWGRKWLTGDFPAGNAGECRQWAASIDAAQQALSTNGTAGSFRTSMRYFGSQHQVPGHDTHHEMVLIYDDPVGDMQFYEAVPVKP